MTPKSSNQALHINGSRNIPLVLMGIAWTQFLVLVTVIPRSEIWQIGKIGHYFFPGDSVPSSEILFIDTAFFGGFALLFNAIALGFLIMPLLTVFKPVIEDDKVRAFYSRLIILANIGGSFWIISFACFLCYLSSLVLTLASCAALFSFFWAGHVLREKSNKS